MGQQGWDGGDHSLDAGRDPDRGGEDVVDHQCGGGKQPRARPKVLGGHRVGSTAGGIRGDGLAIAEKDDDQQNENGRNDRDQVVDAGDAQRNQQGERGLRAIRRGRKRVEAEDRNSCGHADMFSAFLARGQGSAK